MISATISSFVTIYLFCLNFSNSLPLFPDDIEYGVGSVAAAGGGGGGMSTMGPQQRLVTETRHVQQSYHSGGQQIAGSAASPGTIGLHS